MDTPTDEKPVRQKLTDEERRERQRKANRENMARKYAEKKAAKLAAGIPDGRTTRWPDLETRLKQKVVFMDTGCWRWIAARDPNTSARVRVGDKIEHAHRMVWEMVNPPLAEGDVLRKLCKGESCVNPDHFEVVTAELRHSARDKLHRLLRNVQEQKG